MQALTDFADQAVVLPMVLALAVGLAAGGWRAGAWRWLVVAGATLGTVGLVKLAVFVWGAPLGIASPSGHAASAVLVYGGAAMLLARSRRAGFAVGGAAGAAMAWSRLALAVHSPGDVAVGLALGVVGLGTLGIVVGREGEAARPWGALLLMGAVLVGLHGTRLPAEPWLRAIAARLGS